MPAAKIKKTDYASINDTAAVEAFMAQLDHPLKAEIEVLRDIIKGAHPEIAERVKWNAPSYFYREDIGAFNLRQQKFVQLILVFPRGLVEDADGIMLGDWKDRRELRFADMAEVEAKKTALEDVLRRWVVLMDTAE